MGLTIDELKRMVDFEEIARIGGGSLGPIAARIREELEALTSTDVGERLITNAYKAGQEKSISALMENAGASEAAARVAIEKHGLGKTTIKITEASNIKKPVYDLEYHTIHVPRSVVKESPAMLGEDGKPVESSLRGDLAHALSDAGHPKLTLKTLQVYEGQFHTLTVKYGTRTSAAVTDFFQHPEDPQITANALQAALQGNKAQARSHLSQGFDTDLRAPVRKAISGFRRELSKNSYSAQFLKIKGEAIAVENEVRTLQGLEPVRPDYLRVNPSSFIADIETGMDALEKETLDTKMGEVVQQARAAKARGATQAAHITMDVNGERISKGIQFFDAQGRGVAVDDTSPLFNLDKSHTGHAPQNWASRVEPEFKPKDPLSTSLESTNKDWKNRISLAVPDTLKRS